MVIVAVGAHPDDIEFGCYGTLAKMRDKHDMYFIVFTYGELSGLKLERLKEAETSADLVEAQLKILGYRDGHIPVNSDSIHAFTKEIDSLKPDIVFTLFPKDTHQDHRAVSAITLSSCRYVPTILFYETPQTNTGFLPNYYVDITDTFEVKEKAMNCHKSQLHKPYLNPKDLRALAQYRAYSLFHAGRLFEAFVLYHHIE